MFFGVFRQIDAPRDTVLGYSPAHPPFLTMTMTPLLKSILFIILCTPLGCAGQGQQTATPQSQDLVTILADPALSQTTVGLHVVNLSTGQTIFSNNGAKLLHPASTMKLFTSALALESLGRGYRYSTILAAQAPAGATVENLYLIGAGDPSLSTADLTALAQQLADQGVSQIDTIICDATIFDDLHYGHGWMWDDQPYKDFAPISGLSVNRNSLDITISPGRKNGQPLSVGINPETSFVTLLNTGITGQTAETDLSVTRDMRENKNTLTISGHLPVQAEPVKILRNIEQPALYTGTLFKEACEKRGIKVKHPPKRGIAPPERIVLASHTSQPLDELLVEMNKESVNIFAELMLKTVSHEDFDNEGTAKEGLLLLESLLDEWGIPTEDVSFADGSGVSRYNLVTPKTLTSLLQKVYQSPMRDAFIHSLPVGGYDGDLDWRMLSLAGAQNVHAKTGYLRGVSTLAGFIDTDSGQTLAFAIMIQNFKGSATAILRVEDQICERLCTY